MMSLSATAVRVLACESSLTTMTSSRSLGRRAPKQGKPPVLPPSKKVLYHVVHVPWQKPEDVKELLWRRHAYNNAVLSLREVFRAELNQKATAGQGLEAMREAEETELDQLIRENEQLNQQKAASRAAFEKEEWRKTQREILEEIDEALRRQRSLVDTATEEVRLAMERSREFVTKEKLESKILAALETPVVYDYAIDRKGQKYLDPLPVKYQEGTPTRQKGRLYDRTLGGPEAVPDVQTVPAAAAKEIKENDS